MRCRLSTAQTNSSFTGDSVLCVRHAHVRVYEHNAAAALSGLSFELVDTDDGVITAADVNAHAAGTAAHPSPGRVRVSASC